MYKSTDRLQPSFLDFNQPMGLEMNPENRWIKMAARIPTASLWNRSQKIRICSTSSDFRVIMILRIHKQGNPDPGCNLCAGKYPLLAVQFASE